MKNQRKINKVKCFACWLFLSLFTTSLFSQTCNNCASPFTTDTLHINITKGDSAAYTIGTGKTLCIFGGGRFTGTITLNGGTICNKGNFYPKVLNFSSGTIINTNNASISAITLGSGKTINNASKSIFTISGTITFSGGSLTNDGILNVKQNIQNNSGTLINRSIINCQQINGSNTITDSGIINTN